MNDFKGAKRRFSEKHIGDFVIVDHYAHHPNEVATVLKTARQKYPNKELVAIFKPNTYSRTKEFPKEFGDSLNVADYIYVTEIDSNRETQEQYPGVSTQMIIDYTKNGKILDEKDINDLLSHKDCVACFMSCASISHLKEDYINSIK